MYNNIYEFNYSMSLKDLLINKIDNSIKTDIDLKQVLDDDTFISEFKQNKEYLIHYLSIEKLDLLLQYLFGNNLEKESSNNKYKYPQIASIIFSTENELILNYLFNIQFFKITDIKFKDLYNINRINYIFEYYNLNKEINYTVAGYLSNILNGYINNRPELIIKIIYNNQNLLKRLLFHSYCYSVSSILSNLINFNKLFLLNENKDEIDKIININNLIANEIINIYLQTLDIKCEMDRNKQLFQIIFDNFKELKEQEISKKNIFFPSEDSIDYILDTLFNNNIKNKWNLVKIVCIMLEIYNNFNIENKNEKLKLNNLFIENMKNYKFNINFKNENIIILTNGLSQINNSKYLLSELSLLNILVNYDKLINLEFDKILMKINILPLFLRIFENYPWNNILHNVINKIIKVILLNDSMFPNTILNFFQDDLFIDFFNKSKDKYLQTKIKSIGYMNYLKNIYENIIEFSQTTKLNLKLDLNSKKWLEFKTTYYDLQNNLENFLLGNFNSKDINKISFEFSLYDIKKKYKDYLNIKYNKNEEEILILEQDFDIKLNYDDKQTELYLNIDSKNICNMMEDNINNYNNIDKSKYNSLNFWKNNLFWNLNQNIDLAKLI